MMLNDLNSKSWAAEILNLLNISKTFRIDENTYICTQKRLINDSATRFYINMSGLSLILLLS